MSLVLRPATPADIPALRALLVETWHKTYDPIFGAEKVTEITGRWHSEARLAEQIGAAAAAPHRERQWVAEEAGRLLATIAVHALAPEKLEIGRLYVLPSAQGRGIGEKLMLAVLAQFPEARTARLDVEPGNAQAIRFYTRFGFRVARAGSACGGDQAAGIAHLVMEAALPLVRPARDGDAQDLFGLITLCFAEYAGCYMDPHEDMPDIARAGGWAARVSEGRALGGAFLVVEDAGGRVGACIAVDFPVDDVAEIHRLYVRPDLRGKGLAARLVGECERIARDAGARSIVAWSDTRFSTAHRLYERLGYARMGETRALGDISNSMEYHFHRSL